MDKRKKIIPFGYGYNEEEAFQGELTFIDDELKKSEEADKEQFAKVAFDEESGQLQFSNVDGEVVNSIDTSAFTPSASVIEDVTYDPSTQKLTMTFSDGQTIVVDLNDFINAEELEEEIAAKADASALTEVSEAVETKADASDVAEIQTAMETLSTAVEGKADESYVDDAVAGKADVSAVTEIQTSVDANTSDIEGLKTKDEELEASIDLKASQSDLDALDGKKADASAVTEVADAVALKADASAVTALEATVAEKADASALTEVAESVEAKADTTAVTAAIATAVEPLAVKADVDAALETKADASTVEGKADMSAVTEVADAVALKADASAVTALEATVAEKADKSEIQDMATKTWVEEQGFLKEDSLEGYAKTSDVDAAVSGKADTTAVTAEIAAAIAPLAIQSDVDVALLSKADVDSVYTKAEVDEEVAAKADSSAVTEVAEAVEGKADEAQLDSMHRKFDALLSMLHFTETDVNNEIVNEELETSNNVVFEDGSINDIKVPETTKSKTITAELEENTNLELTSRYGVTINNTSDSPTNLNVTAPAVEGYNAATITLNSGEYDTITVKDASLTVGTGSSVQNVVITSATTKSLTINALFAEGATVTSESDAPITVTAKNGEGEEVSVTLNAPNSTVTFSGGKWQTVDAIVSDNTLIINNNVHIGTLNVAQGNVLVKVARQSDIASIVENYTLATGSSIDYIKDEVTNANQSILNTTGEHTLMEDIAHSGNYSVGMFSTDDIVWKLNSNTITITNTRGVAGFRLRGSAKLEVDGPGEMIVPDDYGLWSGVNDGTATSIVVNGGKFTANTHVLYAEKGVIEVNGGEFHMANADADKDPNGNFRFLLNCLDANYKNGTANIVVKGGKFYDFDPGNCYAEGEGTSFLAPGYVSVMTTEIIEGVEHKVYTVQQA